MSKQLFCVLNDLDLEIISIETGASVEYIKAVANEVLSNRIITRLLKKRALTILIQNQTEESKKFLLTISNN